MRLHLRAVLPCWLLMLVLFIQGGTFQKASAQYRIRAQGLNANGELGDGTTTQRNSPIQLSGLGSVRTMAAGAHHTVAVKSDGTVYAWGLNATGQLGDGTSTQRTSPVQVSGLTHVVRVAAGFNHSLAVKDDGTVWAWGDNSKG